MSTSTLEHPRGDHRCIAYRGDRHRERVSQQFFAEGLTSDEKLIYVADGAGPDALTEWLTANISPDRLTLSHITDIYPAGGSFDGPSTVATFRELAASARAEGYSTIRAAADLTKLAADPSTTADLVNYELLIDVAIQEEGLHGLCLYDRLAVPQHVPALHATHPPHHEHTSLPTASVRGEVLSIRGELDLLGVESITDVLACAPDDVRVVSLAGLAFLDAKGGGALWEFASDRDRRGTPVVFEGASRTVRTVLDVFSLV